MLHAFFKSILFLSSGYVMRRSWGGQDFRFSGGVNFFGVTYVFVLVSCLCLMGFPFLLGFYSKDTIIGSFSLISGVLFYILFLVGCVLTVLYSGRFVMFIFPSVFMRSAVSNNKESVVFFLSSSILSFFCCFRGVFYFWFFLSDCFIFFRLFDYVVGFLIFFSVFRLFILAKILLNFVDFILGVGFVSWIRTGGVTSFFPRLTY